MLFRSTDEYDIIWYKWNDRDVGWYKSVEILDHRTFIVAMTEEEFMPHASRMMMRSSKTIDEIFADAPAGVDRE